MKEEVVLNYLNKGLELVDRLAIPQIGHIPGFGVIAAALSKILVGTITGETEGLFKDAYERSIELIAQPIAVASPVRLNKFYKFYYDTLAKSIGPQIDKNDVEYLKSAYPVLFKILVLDDVVLASIYFDEINSSNWAAIVSDFNSPNNRIKAFSDSVQLLASKVEQSDILGDLEKFAKDLYAEFSSEYKNDPIFRDQLVKTIRNILGSKK